MVSSPTARPLLPILILLLSSTGWGFSWMPLQWFSGKGLPGPTLILLAFGVATLIMLPLVMTQKMDFWHNKSLILSIMLFGGMTNVCFQSAMYHGEVVRVMILFYLLPVWSVLGGKFFLKEPFDILRVSTLFLAVVGAFLILGAEKIFAQAPSWIDALALLSGVTFSMNNIVFRHAQNISVALKVFAMFLGTSILIGIVLLFQTTVEHTISLDMIGLAGVYGIFGVLVVTLGSQWGVHHLPAGKASIIIVMELVVAVLSAMVLLGERLDTLEALGLLMVISAAILEGFHVED